MRNALPISVAVGRSESNRVVARSSFSISSSTSSGSLKPLRGEELDAVVLERVVRCGDHHAGVGAHGFA